MKVLVTGGAGFIGSALVRHIISKTPHEVLNLDALTYAANLDALADVQKHSRYRFVKGDIADAGFVEELVGREAPDAILNLAAETHVDRSIESAAAFVRTNMVGTQVLLDAARKHLGGLPEPRRSCFRFLQVSTDEVFGSLGDTGLFTENSPYAPSSPYAASKAGADHLVRAWHRTYGLPALITNCSNNYGPWQFPEKLIPLMITKALEGEPLPVYGKGLNVRDWLFVEDHAEALILVLERGQPGETYNIGGDSQLTNIDVVKKLCALLDRMAPRPDGASYERQISFVDDRPGHDLRYAIDAAKIARELNWKLRFSFDSGLEQTVRWYLEQRAWWSRVRVERYGGERLGSVNA